MAAATGNFAVALLCVFGRVFGHDVRRHAQASIDATGDTSLMVPWPLQESGVLCQSMPYVYVTSRETCQSFALELHHDFYAHRSDLQPERCITFEDCSAPIYGKSTFWKLYAKPARERPISEKMTADELGTEDGICVDTWLPEWTEDPMLACQRWANDSSWGALRKGRSLKEACGSFWAQLNCAKTCGCEGDDDDVDVATSSVTKVVTQVETCKDSWLPSWAGNSTEACSTWPKASWGALKVASSLAAACHSTWAQERCAKTCGCPNQLKAKTPSMSASDGLKSGDDDARKLAAEMAQ